MKPRASQLVIPAFLLVATIAEATVRYVDVNSTTPTPPFTSWALAAANIQDALDAAAAGDQVLVTNGVYQAGGRLGGDGTMSRVVATNLVTLQSMNGFGVTVIDGGGAMRCVYLANGAALSGFTVRGGRSGQGGGGIRCASFSNELVASCLVISNSASTGGGINFGTGSNCIIAWNNSQSSGGGTESCVLNNCTLSNNTAGFLGGGASGGISVLNNCLVFGNASVGGTNGLVGGGGGVFGSILNNCLVISNSCPYAGAGGGTYDCILNNCTVCGNSARFDGGGGIGTSSGFMGIFPSANNCIVFYNTSAAAGANFNTQSALTNCCTTPLAPGLGNLTNAPLLINPAAGDFHLQSNSPCINAGKNTYVSAAADFDGNPRIVGGTVDIGAYEFQSPASVISYAWLQQYGLPANGSADFTDPDGDGMNNWQEWICGTDPTNALSVLKMLRPVRAVQGLTVSWQSVTNRSYFLQRATELAAPPAFLTVATNIAGRSGGTTTFTDPNATGGGPYYYQVGVQH